jgi:hypothetical protein
MTAMPNKTGRNDPCHCGSGQKYKRCCLEKDQAAQSTVLAAQAAVAAAKQAEFKAEMARAAFEQEPDELAEAPANSMRQRTPPAISSSAFPKFTTAMIDSGWCTRLAGRKS